MSPGRACRATSTGHVNSVAVVRLSAALGHASVVHRDKVARYLASAVRVDDGVVVAPPTDLDPILRTLETIYSVYLSGAFTEHRPCAWVELIPPVLERLGSYSGEHAAPVFEMWVIRDNDCRRAYGCDARDPEHADADANESGGTRTFLRRHWRWQRAIGRPHHGSLARPRPFSTLAPEPPAPAPEPRIPEDNDLESWRRRTARTCPVCGSKTINDAGKCTWCGARKQGHGSFTRSALPHATSKKTPDRGVSFFGLGRLPRPKLALLAAQTSRGHPCRRRSPSLALQSDGGLRPGAPRSRASEAPARRAGAFTDFRRSDDPSAGPPVRTSVGAHHPKTRPKAIGPRDRVASCGCGRRPLFALGTTPGASTKGT
jgi:hypothetical protein